MNEPITPEVLEQLGFEKSDAVTALGGAAYVKDGLVISVAGDGIFVVEGSPRVQLTSVTHLKDMYEALTGKAI